ncbi:MAG TPA: hypothetical protein VIG08_12565 [Gemmatimonadales bacterium]|jgi:hypothetical protein
MYRIELKPGEENVFRTIEELAIGIRNGLVTPKARIFHNASQKWLPIEFHPHYKKALSMPPAKSGETPAVVVKRVPDLAPPHAPAPAQTQKPSTALSAPLPASEPIRKQPETIRKQPEAIQKPPVVPPPAPAPAPPPVPAPVPAPAPVLERRPPAVVSPVVDLPTIAYDETAEELAPLPVAHPPLSRTEVRRIKPVYLGVAAAALIVGSYVALSAATPSRKTEASGPETSSPQPMAEAPAAQVASAPSVDSVPAKSTGGKASTLGPTFGGPALIAKAPIVTSAGASPPHSAVKDSAASIEPAPAAVDLSVPSLPSGDSLAPTTLSDTGAMRRILREVSGKGAASRP